MAKERQITIEGIKEAFTQGVQPMTNNQLASELISYLFQLADYKEEEDSELSQRVAEIFRKRALRLYDKLEAIGYFESVKEGGTHDTL